MNLKGHEIVVKFRHNETPQGYSQLLEVADNYIIAGDAGREETPAYEELIPISAIERVTHSPEWCGVCKVRQAKGLPK